MACACWTWPGAVQFAVFALQVLDVPRVLVVLAHHREEYIFLAPPVRPQHRGHVSQQPLGGGDVTPFQGPYGAPRQIGRALVLGDVVLDEGNLAATAVMAHLGTSRIGHRPHRQPRQGGAA